MRIVWTRQASRELDAIGDYIRRQSPAAANRTVARIVHQINMLAELPHIGRVGRVADTHELVITNTPYIVPYRIRDNQVEVLSVIHTARRWPDSFD